MKKFYAIFAGAIVSIAANAQYSVGDLIEKDEVKAIVIQVDETGEHGLMMSLTGPLMMQRIYDETLAAAGEKPSDEKAAKKFLSNVHKASNKKWNTYIKAHWAKVAPHYAALVNEMDGDGRHNAEVIKKYCSDNNLSLEEYFPAQHWASTLGEDWFIPGDNELEYYSYIVGNGLGKKLYKGGLVVKNFYDKYNALVREIVTREGFQNARLSQTIWSSTMSMGKKSACRNCFRSNFVHTQFFENYWWETAPLPDNFFIIGTAADCAVCEF